MKIGLSFNTKLMLLFLMIILIVFGYSGYVTYRMQMDFYSEEISKQHSLLNEQLLAQLELRIQDLYRVSDSIVYNPYVANIVGNSAKPETLPYDRYQGQRGLGELISKVQLDVPHLLSLYIYDLNGHEFYFDHTGVLLKREKEAAYGEVREMLEGTTGETKWWSADMESSIVNQEKRRVYIAARKMINQDFEEYGVLAMVFNPTIFSNFLTGSIAEGAGKVYLLNPQDELLYSDQPAIDALSVSELMNLRRSETLTVDESSYLLAKNKSRAVGFTLISQVSLQEIQDHTNLIYRILFLSVIMSIVLATSLYFYGSRRMLKPLKQLITGMRAIRSGQFDAKVDIRTKDELAFIGHSFNEMAAHIHTLINEVYERNLSAREAELKSLQAQLNPHFLYNTLDSIYWKVYMNDDQESAQLIVSLSELLRYSLLPANDFTTLQEEMDQVRNYLQIQQARFGDDLLILFRVDDEVLNCRMIRLLLQPLVENIFVHAFNDATAERRIAIHAYRSGDELLVEVSDNGCGMDEDKRSELLGHMTRRAEGNARESLGLMSVQRRIQLIFGDPYRMEIKSSPGNGTTVTLLLPFVVPNQS